VEIEHFFVPFSGSFHLSIWLVADAVVDKLEVWLWHNLIERFLEEVILESREENTFVLTPLNESMSSVSVCLHCCHYDRTVLVLHFIWFHHGSSTSLDCFLENSCGIIDGEGNILDSVAVFLVLFVPLFMTFWVQWSSESKANLTISYDMSGELSLSGFKTLISFIFKSESRAVITGGLLSIANPEGNVIESIKYSD